MNNQKWLTNVLSFSQVNQLQITSDLTCKHLLNNSIAVLIVQTNYENQQIAQNVFSAVSYSLAFYRVPVLSVTVRGAEFSKKALKFFMLIILISSDLGVLSYVFETIAAVYWGGECFCWITESNELQTSNYFDNWKRPGCPTIYGQIWRID